MAKENSKDNGDTNEIKPTFSLKRLMVKDISFKVHEDLDIFKIKEWQPKLDLKIALGNKKLEKDMQEVVLTLDLQTNNQNQEVFHINIQQAGLFEIKDFQEDQLGPLLEITCPSLLYPYASSAIADAITKGGFPPIYLNPINFTAIYQAKLKKQAEKQN